jgi:uncharacterized hydantoinase/oxoprolinase family protein
MKSVGRVILAITLTSLFSAPVFSITLWQTKESSNSWRSQKDACTYAIARAREAARKECRNSLDGKPKEYDANCIDYRQLRSGEWKATAKLNLECKTDKYGGYGY